MINLIKLFLAHLIGDFFLQTSRGIEQKKSKKWKSPYLYWHSLIHFFLIILFFRDVGLWPLALFISVTHFIVDGIKVSFSHQKNTRTWFFADQLAHVFILIIAWLLFFAHDIEFAADARLWVIFAGLVFITNPAGYIIQNIVSRWDGELEKSQEQSLSSAGKTIGVVERILVYIAILAGYPAAIGFLIGAKSIFRFGDLTRAKDRKLTEFILIGTLISFLLAVLAGIAVKAMIQ